MASREPGGRSFLERFVGSFKDDNERVVDEEEQSSASVSENDHAPRVDVHEIPASFVDTDSTTEIHTPSNEQVTLDEELERVSSFDDLVTHVESHAPDGYYMTPGERPFPFPAQMLIEGIRAVGTGEERVDDFPEMPGVKDALFRLVEAQERARKEAEEAQSGGGVPTRGDEKVEVQTDTNSSESQSDPTIEGGDKQQEQPLVDAVSVEESITSPHSSFENAAESPFSDINDYKALSEYLDSVGPIGLYSTSHIKVAVRAYRKGELALAGVPNIPGLRDVLARLGSDPEQLVREDQQKKRLVEEVVQKMDASPADPLAEVPASEGVPNVTREDVLTAFGRTDTDNWTGPVIEDVHAPKGVEDETLMVDTAVDPDVVRHAFSAPVVRTEEELAEADQYFKGQGIDLRDSEQHSESAPLVPFEDATQNIEAEVTVERIKTIEEVKEEELAQAFAERFSIAREELDAIPGFNDLALAQKHLVLQNLAESTVNRIEETAAEQYRTDLATERGSKTLFGSALLGNVWISIRESLTKGKHVLEREQTQAAALRAGGIGAHGEVLTQLVRGMREMGPRANFREDGELVVEYAGEWNGISEEGKRTLALFNEIAHDYAKQTYEDGIARSRRALRAEREGYEGYERQKRYLMSIMEREGVPPAEILTKMAETDAQITMSQFVQSKEDAMKTLATIEDRKIWDEVVRSIATERGIYAASGYVARSAITGLFGIFAAPVVASGVGFIRSWKRADAELRERDRAQRRGAIVRGETAQNMVSASGERGAVAKMHHLLARINMLDEQLAGVGEQVDTQETPAVDREQLLEKRRALFLSLRERLSYTEDKLRLGLIDFGATDRLAQQYALMHELTQVKARLIDEEGDRKIDIERSALSTLNDTFESLDRVDTELREFGNTGNLDAIEALLEERANLQLALRNHFDSEKVKERLGFAGQGNEVLDTSYDLVKERVYRTARRAVHWHTFLDTQLAKKERSISRARRWFMVKEAGEGALTAGGFALLGSLIGEMFGGKTTVETAVENNSPDVPSAVPSQDEMLQPVPQAVEESAREAVSAARESLVHEVRPGETLTSIMRAQLGGETDRFIAELKGFIARGDISMKDVLDAGIKSGNIDRIIPGESIDVSKLQALVDSVKK